MRSIKVKHLDEEIIYDGSQIAPLWALKKAHIQGDSIITFIGPMKVRVDEMLDMKDVIRESGRTDTPISSDEAIHFIIEHFDTSSPKVAFLRQRLLVSAAFETIRCASPSSSRGLRRRFGDIYHSGKKLSVSVASVSPACMKIHMGINVLSSGAPAYVKTIGLKDLRIKAHRALARRIADLYKSDVIAIEEDICKVRQLA